MTNQLPKPNTLSFRPIPLGDFVGALDCAQLSRVPIMAGVAIICRAALNGGSKDPATDGVSSHVHPVDVALKLRGTPPDPGMSFQVTVFEDLHH